MQARTGDRGLVNAKLLIRQEKQQRRVSDIAQDRVTGRAEAEEVAEAGAGQGRAGQGRNGQDQTGQNRKVRDNTKGNALGDTGHSALQDEAKGMIDCGAGRMAGQSGLQDRERVGNTAVGETLCREMQA